MQCLHCQTQFPDNMSVCPNCGAPAGNPAPQGQPFNGQMPNQPFNGQMPNQQFNGQPYGSGPKLSKKEFLKHPNLKKVAGNIKGSAITLYVCAAISLVVALIGNNLSSLLDVFIILGLALGIQLAQSRACAIIVCVYSVFNIVIMFISSGTFGGWLILLAAIYAIIATSKFQKAWKEYQQTGILPAEL